MRNKTHISIVGGGIAGLALAAILAPDRFDVTVYEEHPDRLGAGTALAMWPGAQRALRAAGADAVLDSSVGLDGGALRNLAGDALVTSPNIEGVRLVARADLVQALSAAVPNSVRRIDRRLDDLRALTADLVVGADGVHSLVRRSVWGASAASRATSYLAVRGLVPGSFDDAYGEYWAAGRLFGITPVPGQHTNWFCSYRSDLGPRSVDVALALADARKRFADAAPAIDRVLTAAQPETTLAQRIWVTKPTRSYVRGGAVLIGDAAHAMTPNLGRGACESLVDADVLGAALNRHEPAEALRRYDRSRVAPTQAARAASAALMRVALATRAARPRNAAMRLIGRAF